MEPLYIAVNIGSASKKYAVYRGKKQLFWLHIEHDPEMVGYSVYDSLSEKSTEVSKNDYEHVLEYLEKIIVLHGFAVSLCDVSAILMRIVAPGIYFQQHRIIDDVFFEKLAAAEHVAPLHLTLQRTEYEEMTAYLKKCDITVSIVGISDSAFHATLPEVARTYGIAREDTTMYELIKFGYHGLSGESALAKVQELGVTLPSRVIVAHLGGGASVMAIKDGVSVDVSMGMTPLDGLLMARRPGQLDAGVLLALMETKGWGVKEMREYLNEKCGLLGVSGMSDDVRELLVKEAEGKHDAKLALDLFAYRVRHYIGAYTAQLGGCDLLIFAGTIGERSANMRARICAGLDGIGIILDIDQNNTYADTTMDTFLEHKESRTKIARIHIDEFSSMVHAYTASKL